MCGKILGSYKTVIFTICSKDKTKDHSVFFPLRPVKGEITLALEIRAFMYVLSCPHGNKGLFV